MAAEYTVNVPAPQNPTISYLTEDALGSPRIITNSFGEIKARRDFLPLGEELFAGIGNRNTNQKYSSNIDDNRQKFTGYQRDKETNLDFAQSRYYSPMQGRFTSPDEFKGGPDELFDFEDDASDNPTFYADLTNPQSLNKYKYTYSNPYKYNDPSGHCPPISSCLDKAQDAADYIGLIPKIGDAVDAANALVSVVRGDYEAAGRRAIAVIPFIGTPISLAMKAGKAARVIAKVVSKADDVSKTQKQRRHKFVKRTKKIKFKLGDVFEILLPSGKFAYGRVYDDAGVRIYKKISDLPNNPPIGSHEFIFGVGMYEKILTSGEWKIVANDPFNSEESKFLPPACVKDVISGEYSIYHKGELKKATKEECTGLEEAAVWDSNHIVERIMNVTTKNKPLRNMFKEN